MNLSTNSSGTKKGKILFEYALLLIFLALAAVAVLRSQRFLSTDSRRRHQPRQMAKAQVARSEPHKAPHIIAVQHKDAEEQETRLGWKEYLCVAIRSGDRLLSGCTHLNLGFTLSPSSPCRSSLPPLPSAGLSMMHLTRDPRPTTSSHEPLASGSLSIDTIPPA